jgi:hypothetical protein
MEESGTGSAERLHRWAQYEVAARRIQNAFRCWNYSRHFKRAYARKRKGERTRVQRAQPKGALEQSFLRIVSEEGSFEDKMAFWRGAIELRRSYKAHSTDLCVRAFIEAAGELGRAKVHLGTSDWCVINKADISSKLKQVFLPKLFPTKTNSNYQQMLLSSLQRAIQVDDSMAGNRLNMIRSLRTKSRVVFQPEQRKNELFSLLNDVVSRTYFSKNHFGNKSAAKLQKMPGKSTARSKRVLEESGEKIRIGRYSTPDRLSSTYRSMRASI